MRFINYFLFSIGLVVIKPAHATWAGMTDQELVDQSVVIVKAAFIGKTTVRLPETQKPRLLGVLKIEHIYKGKLADVVLLNLPLRPPNVSASTDIHHTVGQHGFWFLRSYPASEGVFLADHPQRFWSLDQQSKLDQLMARTVR